MYGASKLSSDELDQLIDDVTKNKASSLIVRPYNPEGAWLWTQWSGSLLQLTRWKVLGLAALAGVNCVLVNNALQADWPLFAMPGPSFDAMIATEPLVARLESLSAVWEYELTLCTFVVTFFLNQAAMRLALAPPSPRSPRSQRATPPACHHQPPRCRSRAAPPPRRPRAAPAPPSRRHRATAARPTPAGVAVPLLPLRLLAHHPRLLPGHLPVRLAPRAARAAGGGRWRRSLGRLHARGRGLSRGHWAVYARRARAVLVGSRRGGSGLHRLSELGGPAHRPGEASNRPAC